MQGSLAASRLTKQKTHEPKRNSPERKAMLAERADRQRMRKPGFTRVRRGGDIEKKIERRSYMVGVPASINRRTKKPHKHERSTVRGMTHDYAGASYWAERAANKVRR